MFVEPGLGNAVRRCRMLLFLFRNFYYTMETLPAIASSMSGASGAIVF
jgi:hypothetical protein